MEEPGPECKHLHLPAPLPSTMLPGPCLSDLGFSNLLSSSVSEEEIIRDAAAYMQEHVQEAWMHSCECVREGVWD